MPISRALSQLVRGRTSSVASASSRLCLAMAITFAFILLFARPTAADLDPAALAYKLPKDIPWVDSGNGSMRAILTGDPNKPGLYVLLNKWKAHNMSRPHFHPNDRFITVLSGTWWVGTGSKYDPDSTVPLPPGTVVTHFAKQIHYDGAKDEDAVLEIVGMGPATSTPAETR